MQVVYSPEVALQYTPWRMIVGVKEFGSVWFVGLATFPSRHGHVSQWALGFNLSRNILGIYLD